MNQLLKRTEILKIKNSFQYCNCQISTHLNSVKSYDEIPGPSSLPIVGNLLTLKNFGNYALKWNRSWFYNDYEHSKKAAKSIYSIIEIFKSSCKKSTATLSDGAYSAKKKFSSTIQITSNKYTKLMATLLSVQP